MNDGLWETDLIYKAANSDRLDELDKHPNKLYHPRVLQNLKDAGFIFHKTKIVAPEGVRPDTRINTPAGYATLPAKHKKTSDPRSIIHKFPRQKSSLYQAYDRNRENNRDFRLLITAKGAKTGRGKTTLAIILAKEFDDGWSADQATLRVMEFLRLYDNLDPGSCIVFDDIEQELNRRRAMSNKNVYALNTIQGRRYRELSTIFTAPTPKTIDKHLESFGDFRIHVHRPGTGIVYKYHEPPADNGPSDEIELRRKHRIHWEAIDEDLDYQRLEEKKKKYFKDLQSHIQQSSQQQTRQAKQKAKKDQRDQNIRRMDRQGYTQQEIADALDISQSTVSRALR